MNRKYISKTIRNEAKALENQFGWLSPYSFLLPQQ
jgi:hypothetical protein